MLFRSGGGGEGVDLDGYEVREKALKEEIARLERRYRIDEDVAEYRRSIGMHERE